MIGLKWWRHLLAKRKVAGQPYEWGGLLFEYKPQQGRLDFIQRWTNVNEQEAALLTLRSMLNGGKDVIYVVMVRVAREGGYILVSGSNNTIIRRHFWYDVYTVGEAWNDMQNYAKKLAGKMGYASPKDFEHVDMREQ